MAYEIEASEQDHLPALLASLPNSGAGRRGGIVRLGPGEWGPISINTSGVILEGEGLATRITPPPGYSGPLIRSGVTDSLGGVWLKHLYLNGLLQTAVSGVLLDSPDAGQSNSGGVENCWIDNCPGGALAALGLGNSWLRSIISSSCGDDATQTPAFLFAGSAHGITCDDVHVWGLDVETANYASLVLNPGVNCCSFAALTLDGGPSYAHLILRCDETTIDTMFALQSANGADIVRADTYPGAYCRSNTIRDPRVGFGDNVTAGSAFHFDNQAGGAGYNRVLGIKTMALPAGTTLIEDSQANANEWDIRIYSQCQGKPYTVTNRSGSTVRMLGQVVYTSPVS